MSLPATTVSPTRPTDPGLDYVTLVEEGTRLVQAMSGQVWTDYNFSDPGVTILEQLCYALTELSYRADFPVEDLVCDPETGQLHPRRHGLYPARSILPSNPVTANDFRRLVIDRVAQTGNVWFTPLPPEQADGVSGLYDIAVLIPSSDPCCADGGPPSDEVRRLVLDCYNAHRALCEDVRDVVILTPLPVEISADVQLDDGADPSVVLGHLQFAVGLYLAPEPQRASLERQLAAGRTTAEIFSGPLMLRGFIGDEQLTAFPGEVPVDGVLQVMAKTPGVLSVDHLSILVEGEPRPFVPGDRIDVPDGGILSLSTPSQEGARGIRLFRADVPCPPNPARVVRVRDRLWAAQRRTYALWPEYAAHYRPPSGQGGDLAAYTSVQNQFPNVYGIGETGLPRTVGPVRTAQARQLKGYLMPFDQLMADYFSQLAFLRTLFSITAGGSTTYACQSLRGIVPDAAPLLAPGYEAGLRGIVAAADPVVPRQLAILNLLLSLYAETLPPPPNASGSDDDAALLRARQALLAHLTPATRDRGRGFDYRRHRPAERMAGLEVRCRIQLALLDRTTDRHRPVAVRDASRATFGSQLGVDLAEVVVSSFLPLDRFEELPLEVTWEDASPLAGHHVAANLLAALGDPRRYRIGRMPGDDQVRLVCHDVAENWWFLGWYPGAAEAIAAAERLVHAASGSGEHLSIVEWPLLRYAAELSGDPGSRYSFRVTAVLAANRTEAADVGWRSQVTAILRQAVPAHVALDCLFLGHGRMHRFRRLYAAWERTLRDGSPERRAETSWRLQAFLEPPPAPEPPPSAPPEPPPSPPSEPLPPEPLPEPPREPTFTLALPPPDPSAATEPATTEGQPAQWQGRLWRESPLPPEPPMAPASVAAPDRRWWQIWRSRAAIPALPAPAAPAAQLPGQAEAAQAGANGFDTDSSVTAEAARAFAAAGFRFAIRSLAADDTAAAGHLTAVEARALLQAGLALMAVQHIDVADLLPTEALGQQYGHTAVAGAREIGLPAGVTIWLELQNVQAETSADDVVACCNAWFGLVAAAGYVPGLCVGPRTVLSDEQLKVDLRVRQYWNVGATAAAVPIRGCCLLRASHDVMTIAGIACHSDTVQADHLHGTPAWLAPDAEVA